MPSQSLRASLHVLDDAASSPVNRRLFGKFTEHLGRNVYGGAWAQIATNPDFAPIERWPDRGAILRRLQRTGGEFKLPALASAIASGLPPYWVSESGLDAALRERRGRPYVAVSAQGSGGALVTPLYLPAHRTRGYVVTLSARGSAPLTVSVRTADGRPLAKGNVQPGPDWAQHELTLSLEGEAPPPGTPCHLVLAPTAAGLIELRQCLLFPDDHLDGWDPDIVRFMREAKLPLLRFPGGNFVSAYHWQNGVGPLEERPVLANPAWPEVEFNHVGTDEWLRLCELVGCEALICINAGDGTPEEAAAWIEYCNGGTDTRFGALRALNGHPEPYGVTLWEVGNELYGSWQEGYTDAVGYAKRYQAFTEAMRAADPSIELIANGDTEEWNRTLVFAAPQQVRSISHHCLYAGYPDDADPERVFLEHMAFTPAYGQMWHELVQPMVEAGLNPCLAVTEQQVFTNKPHLPNNATLTEALWTASIYNEAIRADGLVEMITHSALVNHGGGLRKEREIAYAQPVWWATHLYAEIEGPLYRLPVEVDSPTITVQPYRLRTTADAHYLDAVALTDEMGDRRVYFLINRHPHAALTLRLDGAGHYGQAELITLSGESYMAVNSWQETDVVAPQARRGSPAELGLDGDLILPPCSLVRLQLTGGKSNGNG